MLVQQRKQIFEKAYGIRCDNLERCQSAFLYWWKWNQSERSLKPDWPPKLSDRNPLDYYFQDRVQEKVHNGCYCYPFAMIDELKRTICDIWGEYATDLPQICKAMKQFLPCQEVVDTKDGGSIKTVF